MSDSQWYYAIDQQQFGPVPQEKIIELLQRGNLNSQNYLWREGFEDWKRAGEIEIFLPFLPAQPPAGSTYIAGQRPASVTVFGVLNIIFGCLGLICIPLSLLGNFTEDRSMNPTEIVKMWLLCTSLLRLLCSFILIILGTGLLNLKRWARKCSVYYGSFILIWNVIATVINLLFVSSGQYNCEAEFLPFAYLGMCFALVIGSIYPILLLIFMQRQIAKDVCVK
jgi:hypothetical protein